MTSPIEFEAAIEALANRLKSLLSGQHPAAAGGALADAVATFLAGHFVFDDVEGTRQLRAQLLGDFVLTVEKLLPICAEEIGTPHDPIVVPGDDEDPYRRH